MNNKDFEHRKSWWDVCLDYVLPKKKSEMQEPWIAREDKKMYPLNETDGWR